MKFLEEYSKEFLFKTLVDLALINRRDGTNVINDFFKDDILLQFFLPSVPLYDRLEELKYFKTTYLINMKQKINFVVQYLVFEYDIDGLKKHIGFESKKPIKYIKKYTLEEYSLDEIKSNFLYLAMSEQAEGTIIFDAFLKTEQNNLFKYFMDLKLDDLDNKSIIKFFELYKKNLTIFFEDLFNMIEITMNSIDESDNPKKLERMLLTFFINETKPAFYF